VASDLFDFVAEQLESAPEGQWSQSRGVDEIFKRLADS
jgi:hypothetical protein